MSNQRGLINLLTPPPTNIIYINIRVLHSDLGGAFGMGTIGGSIWHFVKGARNSPRGARLAGAIDAVKVRAPALGGSFAVWGGLFSVFDCTLIGIRRKEDPWNSIAAGAMTGGVLSSRAGVGAAGKSALAGGIILALIEGVSFVMSRQLTATPPISPEEMRKLQEQELERSKKSDSSSQQQSSAEGLAAASVDGTL